jgi:hypothetical protein
MGKFLSLQDALDCFTSDDAERQKRGKLVKILMFFSLFLPDGILSRLEVIVTRFGASINVHFGDNAT